MEPLAWGFFFVQYSVSELHTLSCLLVLFSVAEQHSNVRAYYGLFIHSLADRYLGCFQCGNILNRAIVNILKQEFLWTYRFIVFLGKYLRADFLVVW